MYRKFTDRSRKVMDLSKTEAVNYSQKAINTGNVLLGLFLEGTGVAAIALEFIGLEVADARRLFEKMAPPSPRPIIGRVFRHIKLDGDAEIVVDGASEAAKKLGCEFVGTEHLLIASMKNRFLSAKILAELGVQPELVRSTVHELLRTETKVGE